jgi:hypothetical protein
MGKEENSSRRKEEFFTVSKEVKKIELSVVEEWPAIVGIEDSLLKLKKIVLRMRLLCL